MPICSAGCGPCSRRAAPALRLCGPCNSSCCADFSVFLCPLTAGQSSAPHPRAQRVELYSESRPQGRALPRILELTPFFPLRPRGRPGQAPACRVCGHRVTPQLRCTYHMHTYRVHIRVSHSCRCPTSEPEHASLSSHPCLQDTGPRPPRQMRHYPRVHRTALWVGSGTCSVDTVTPQASLSSELARRLSRPAGTGKGAHATTSYVLKALSSCCLSHTSCLPSG